MPGWQLQQGQLHQLSRQRGVRRHGDGDEKFGVCYLNGGITLTGAVSGWVTLLDSNAVPAPQTGEAIIMTLPSWKAPTTNPARLRISGRVADYQRLANAFWTNLAYPIG